MNLICGDLYFGCVRPCPPRVLPFESWGGRLKRSALGGLTNEPSLPQVPLFMRRDDVQAGGEAEADAGQEGVRKSHRGQI